MKIKNLEKMLKKQNEEYEKHSVLDKLDVEGLT